MHHRRRGIGNSSIQMRLDRVASPCIARRRWVWLEAHFVFHWCESTPWLGGRLVKSCWLMLLVACCLLLTVGKQTLNTRRNESSNERRKVLVICWSWDAWGIGMYLHHLESKIGVIDDGLLVTPWLWNELYSSFLLILPTLEVVSKPRLLFSAESEQTGEGTMPCHPVTLPPCSILQQHRRYFKQKHVFDIGER